MRRSGIYLFVLLSLLLLSHTASAAESGILNQVVEDFRDASSRWGAIISGYATWLFWTLATISLVWTFGFMAMRKADIGEFFAEFIRFCIFTGFYLWLLRNGPAFAMDIVRSMMTIGSKAGGVAELSPSTPVDIAFDIFERAYKSVTMRHPIDSLAIVLVTLIIMVCLATVAANVLLVLVTAWIMAYAGMFVLGFGGSRWTSDIALGYFRTVAGIAMKLLTMTLMIGIATSIVDGHLDDIKNGAKIEQLLVVCVVSLVLAILIHSIPNMVASLIPGGGATGSVGSFSAGAVAGAAVGAVSTAASVAGSAMSGGASLAKGLAGGAQSMYSAFTGGQSAVSSGMDMVSQVGGMLGGGGGGSPMSAAMGLVGGGDSGSATAAPHLRAGGDTDSSNSAASGGSSISSGGSMAQLGGGNSGLPMNGGGEQRANAPAAASEGRKAGGTSGGVDGSSKSSPVALGGRELGFGSTSGAERVEAKKISSMDENQFASSASSPMSVDNGVNANFDSRDFDPGAEVAAYRDSKQESV